MNEDSFVVVGLGNPGSKYDGTRHNIGFAAIDALHTLCKGSAFQGRGVSDWKEAGQLSLSNARAALSGSLGNSGWNQLNSSQAVSSTVKIRDCVLHLIKPITFMNLSGQPLAQFLSFRKISLNKVVILHDEIDIPVGAIRVKVGGGEGGHNGLRSIVSECGGKDFARVRIGVGKPPRDSPAYKDEDGIARWVLARYTADELPIVEKGVANAVAATLSFIYQGVEATQNKFN